MKVYVSHSKNFDFKSELYKPLKSAFPGLEFIFPHEKSDQPFESRKLMFGKGCNLVLAEISFPSTGQGIELGWANANGIPIICIHKEASQISHSLKLLTTQFFKYRDIKDISQNLSEILKGSSHA